MNQKSTANAVRALDNAIRLLNSLEPLDDPKSETRGARLHWHTEQGAVIIDQILKSILAAQESLGEESVYYATLQEIGSTYEQMTVQQLKEKLGDIRDKLEPPARPAGRSFMRGAATLAAGAAVELGAPTRAGNIPQLDAQSIQRMQEQRASTMFRTLQEAQAFANRIGVPASHIFRAGDLFLVVQNQQQRPPYYDSLKRQAMKMEAATGNQFRSIIEEAVKRAPLTGDFEIDVMLIEAMILRESGGDPKRVSSAGAQGLLQLMPFTFSTVHKGKLDAKRFGASPYHSTALLIFHPKRHKHQCNRFDPEQNIDAGVRYLRYLIIRYNKDPKDLLKDVAPMRMALSMYNGGEGAVLAGRLSQETQHYGNQVLGLEET